MCWCCLTKEKNKCKARVVTTGNHVVIKRRDHNHEPTFKEPAGSPSSTLFEPQVNDYVVVKLLAQRSVKHYIAVIMSKAEDEFVAKFMRKSLGNKFTFPATDDVANIDQDDIAEILSQPSVNNRQQYTFSLDISKYKNFG
ncbi:hypothetical protein D910_12470 [Dendroctonus ponderosae]